MGQLITTQDGYQILQDSLNPLRWELRCKRGYYLMDLHGSEKEVRKQIQEEISVVL